MNIIINDILIPFIDTLSYEEIGKVFAKLLGKNIPLSSHGEIVFKQIYEDTISLQNKRSEAGKKGNEIRWKNRKNRNAIKRQKQQLDNLSQNRNAITIDNNDNINELQAQKDNNFDSKNRNAINNNNKSQNRNAINANNDLIINNLQEQNNIDNNSDNRNAITNQQNSPNSPSPYKERILNNQDSQLSNTQVFKLNETNSLLFKENKNLNKTLNNISLVSLHTTQAHTHTHAHEENAQNETVFSSPNDNGKESAEKEKSSAKKEKEQAQFVVDKFNQICKSFSPVRTLTDARVRHINNRLADMEKVAAQENKSVEDILNELLNNLEQSSFLKGDNSRGWKADFNWLFSYKGNWVKVLEGNYKHTNLTEYDNTRGHTTTTFTHRKWINPRLQENEERREMVKRGITKREYTKEDEEREEANIARLLGRHAAMVREVTKATTDLLTANSKEDKQTDGGY